MPTARREELEEYLSILPQRTVEHVLAEVDPQQRGEVPPHLLDK